MLFFVVCACFALFPEKVLCGAQNGLALCINSLIPSLLPFMIVSSAIIKSGFSRPLGAALSKIITPFTRISPCGCICLITGLLGGYGTGARAIYESYRENYITKKEAESLLAFCNNAGPLFILGTVGIGFFMNKGIGAMLLAIQVVTVIICAIIFGEKKKGEKSIIKNEWHLYKKNKPPMGALISRCAIESGSAIVTACVFVITFGAILEILPFGSHRFLAGFLEVTRGTMEMSRIGTRALPFVSAFLYWGGMSVHFQANALTEGVFSMKKYYIGKITGCIIAFLFTMLIGSDINILFLCCIAFFAVVMIILTIKTIFFPKCIQPRVFRQQRHS